MREKLGITVPATEHFALVLLYLQCSSLNDLIILRPEQRLAEVALWPGVQRCQCILRLVFYPARPVDLLRTDPRAFDYFYSQVSDHLCILLPASLLLCYDRQGFHFSSLIIHYSLISSYLRNVPQEEYWLSLHSHTIHVYLINIIFPFCQKYSISPWFRFYYMINVHRLRSAHCISFFNSIELLSWTWLFL